MKRLIAGLCFGGSLWIVACGTSTGPDGNRTLGHVIEGTPPMTSLIAPATVQSGVPFHITASTFGSGSCTYPDGYRLDTGPTRIEVRLYDRYAPPQSICTLDLRRFARDIVLQFDKPGIAQVVVIGRGGSDGEPLEIVQAVTVLPE